MKRKPDAIDIVKLYCLGNTAEWNAHLQRCYDTADLRKLTETRRRVQAGMAKAAKDGLNTEKMINFFIRLQNSIELTMKKIIREKNPNPCDDPLIAKDHTGLKGDKKRRDDELEKHLRKSGY